MAEQKPGSGTGGRPADWDAVSDPADIDIDGGRSGDRILNQDEIDNLLGFRHDENLANLRSGIRALINSSLVSYERLPMLEVVFDRLVRLATTTLRNFTSENVEVSIDQMTSVRFGEYLNSIPLPAMMGVFRAVQWDNFGLMTIDSNLIYSVIDVLLGGNSKRRLTRIEGRPYTTIETNLISRLIDLMLADAEQAFRPLAQIEFKLDRLETNPRFAAIARPGNAAILVRFRIDMEERGGQIQFVLPYATIEPIRVQLLQMFMGEKFGRDSDWESHLATEIHSAEVDVRAYLFDQDLPLKKVIDLKVGQTIVFPLTPQSPVQLKCGDVPLTAGVMGRRRGRISIQVSRPLDPPKTTLADFEGNGTSPEMRS